MKYHIITFGCQMNKSDSERIAAVLEQGGYQKASKTNGADLIVVNMCSVRQSAVDRVYGLLPKFKKLKIKNHELKTVLIGCILKSDLKKLRNHFNYILNIKDLPTWQSLPPQQTPTSRPLRAASYLKIQPASSSFPVAYVPISYGCNNHCTYCVVPYTRGPEIDRPAEDIINEIKNLTKNGYKEIWLLGQNVNSYRARSRLTRLVTRKNAEINFPSLLRMVNAILGEFWIRFASPHPKDFSDELIETIADCQKVTPYLNLPVQSGDNEILKKMNRGYTIEEYKNLVKKIRTKIPTVSLSTDIIVGFPGETKKNFENTKKLVQQIKYEMAYIARYSPRPGTVAALTMKDDITYKEKNRREGILTKILKKTALEKNKRYIGKIVTVLAIKHKDNNLYGKSLHHKSVQFMGPKHLIGKFVKVKITKALSFGLKGERM